MDKGEEDFKEVGEGQVGMIFPDGAPNLGCCLILVAHGDVEPQDEEDVMHLGTVKNGVGLSDCVPEVKILEGMVVVRLEGGAKS